MCGECLNTSNKGNGCVVAGQIESLSEEGKLKLVRRGRDIFNKNREAQAEMLAFMLTGGLIRKDDLI